MPNGGYCVNYPSNSFRNTRGFENWGKSLRYSPVLAGGGIFSHMTYLEESRFDDYNIINDNEQ